MRNKDLWATQCKQIKWKPEKKVYFLIYFKKKKERKINTQVPMNILDFINFMEGERFITRINFTSKVMTAEILYLLYP